MKYFFHTKTLWIVGAAILIGIALLSMFSTLLKPEIEPITTTVERGDIRSIISVSGVVESDNAAELAFPISGIVSNINIDEGDEVKEGDILITLTQENLLAQLRNAQADLTIAHADKEELISGPRAEARDVTKSTLEIAEENLKRVTDEYDERVASALRTLYSSNLEAVPVDGDEQANPPTISGTYTCSEGTSYDFSTYSSNSSSGYSYHLNNENGAIYTAYTKSAQPFGSCGLLMQFSEGSSYGNSDWIIEVPNTRGSLYTANNNAYALAVKQRTHAIDAAMQELNLAKNNESLDNADPRNQELVRANARISQANAQIASIRADINDRTIRAPFDGVITDVAVLEGEVSGVSPVVTLVSNSAFELTMRVPEIDITKIEVGDKTEVIFDAQASEVIDSSVKFISPLGIEIDGVAYYEGQLAFDATPSWLRSGLNADIDIIIDQVEGVLRVPKRFLIEKDDSFYVPTFDGTTIAEKPVEVGFRGNDGYVEINGIEEGTILAIPPDAEEQ